MQTKSEMINRIAELAKEVEQWKHEYEVLDAYLELAQGKIAELKEEISTLQGKLDAYQMSEQEASEIIAELKAENEQLKELKCKFKEYCTCNTEKYIQTLQEIKAIAEENQFYFRPGTIVSYETIKQLATSFEQILKLITKEEE